MTTRLVFPPRAIRQKENQWEQWIKSAQIPYQRSIKENGKEKDNKDISISLVEKMRPLHTWEVGDKFVISYNNLPHYLIKRGKIGKRQNH